MARRASQNAQDQGLSSRLEVVVALGNWLSELMFKEIGSGQVITPAQTRDNYMHMPTYKSPIS